MRTSGVVLLAAAVSAAQLSCKDSVATTKNLPGAYVPQCGADGAYLPKQCWPSTGECWCVDALTGATLQLDPETNCGSASNGKEVTTGEATGTSHGKDETTDYSQGTSNGKDETTDSTTGTSNGKGETTGDSQGTSNGKGETTDSTTGTSNGKDEDADSHSVSKGTGSGEGSAAQDDLLDCEWSASTSRPWSRAQHDMCCGVTSDLECTKDDEDEVRRAAAVSGCVRALFTQDEALLRVCCAEHMIGCRAVAEQACFGKAIPASKAPWCCRVHGLGCTDGCAATDVAAEKAAECCKERGTHCARAPPVSPPVSEKVAAPSEVPQEGAGVAKRLRMKVRGSMADFVENPKKLHLQMKLRLLRAVKSLRAHPHDVRITRLGALMKGGAMPGADKAASWTVDVPEEWDAEIADDVAACSAAWPADDADATPQQPEAPQQRAAAALQAKDAGAGEGLFFEAVITKKTDAGLEATVDEVRKAVAAQKQFVPIGSGVEEVRQDGEVDNEGGVSPLMLALSAAAGALCVGLVVLGVLVKRGGSEADAYQLAVDEPVSPKDDQL